MSPDQGTPSLPLPSPPSNPFSPNLPLLPRQDLGHKHPPENRQIWVKTLPSLTLCTWPVKPCLRYISETFLRSILKSVIFLRVKASWKHYLTCFWGNIVSVLNRNANRCSCFPIPHFFPDIDHLLFGYFSVSGVKHHLCLGWVHEVCCMRYLWDLLYFPSDLQKRPLWLHTPPRHWNPWLFSIASENIWNLLNLSRINSLSAKPNGRRIIPPI